MLQVSQLHGFNVANADPVASCVDICDPAFLAGDMCMGPYWNGDAFFESNYGSMNLYLISPPLPGPFASITVVVVLPGTQAARTLSVFAGSNALSVGVPANATVFAATFALTDSPENWTSHINVDVGTFPGGTWYVDQLILHTGSAAPCME